ncbi:RNA-directed DNA polymerase (reverse transcriptase)-related family protein [Rhynchospora pubera]|uniref:RNA-directed DNA polymerase (Reverse transcriptase)-related family protein n=1 Tax=Rhynchospora pubera TaxID=906938 RepID=A0AAV8FQF6_9POAL|nr:RNA-directed DNA polymerase (reverse transcriptase)-related family protein [Rhynchospora pubera]
MGGRLVLLNSVLTASPLYFFSIFRCPAWVLTKIDRIRRNFLWGSYQSFDKKKFCLVSWQIITKQKEFGGWGILNLHHMNTALLGKWIWKYHFKEHTSIWKSIVTSRYNSFDNTSTSSPLWKTLSRLKPLFNLGCKRIVGNGDNISFWNEVWLDNIPLSRTFPLLFNKTNKPKATISQVWNEGKVKLSLSRGISNPVRSKKTVVLNILNELNLNSEKDSIFWNLDSRGFYSVRSLYSFLNNLGITCNLNHTVWPIKVPLKAKLLLWLILNNKILTLDNLQKKGWQGPNKCVFCDNLESVDHIFLNCPSASNFWTGFNLFNDRGINLNFTNMSSIWFSINNLKSNDRAFTKAILATWCSVVWNERNNMVFRDFKTNEHNHTIFRTLHLFLNWTGTSTGLAANFRDLTALQNAARRSERQDTSEGHVTDASSD